MKLLDKWMDMVESIECSDEVAEQQRMRLEKYEGPGSFASQAFQQLLIYWIVKLLYSLTPQNRRRLFCYLFTVDQMYCLHPARY
jgi:hypothetical protein